jgi:hypothetical protein
LRVASDGQRGRQMPPQSSVPDRHIGVVVVEVVLVEVLVDVEVVGVVVDVEVVGVVVEVEVVGVVVDVLVEVLVVLLVDVLVVVVVGAAVVVVVPHGPLVSPCPRCPPSALSGTLKVFSSGVPGLWQMVTFCC